MKTILLSAITFAMASMAEAQDVVKYIQHSSGNRTDTVILLCQFTNSLTESIGKRRQVICQRTKSRCRIKAANAVEQLRILLRR